MKKKNNIITTRSKDAIEKLKNEIIGELGVNVETTKPMIKYRNSVTKRSVVYDLDYYIK